MHFAFVFPAFCMRFACVLPAFCLRFPCVLHALCMRFTCILRAFCLCVAYVSPAFLPAFCMRCACFLACVCLLLCMRSGGCALDVWARWMERGTGLSESWRQVRRYEGGAWLHPVEKSVGRVERKVHAAQRRPRHWWSRANGEVAGRLRGSLSFRELETG